MADRLKLFRDLKELLNDYKKNIDGFDKNLNDLDNLFIKIGNYQDSQKVVFIGRGGGRKSELVYKLINFTMPDKNLKNNKFIEYNLCKSSDMPISESFVDSCLKIYLPKSENSILDGITILDTPFYNSRDDLDSEIIEKCKESNIFVLVLNAVGSIGDSDKRFLKRISKNTFVNRLIFVFTNMENVLESELISAKNQHESYSYIIANEILHVQQTRIPTFFVRNNKLDTEKFSPLLKNFNLTSDDKINIWKNVLEILGKLEKLVEDEKIKNNELVNHNKDCLTTEGISNYKNENYDLNSEKLELIKKLKDNIKNPDFPDFAKFDRKETKEEIENKLEEIKKLEDNEYFVKESEWKCKIPQDIISIINEFLKLFDDLLNFTEEIDGDQFRFLPNKYDQLVGLANGITDEELFYLIGEILIDIELELILISIHFEKDKLNLLFRLIPSIIYQHKRVQISNNHIGVLQNILSQISSANIKKGTRSATSSNVAKHVDTKPISNQNNFVENSDEILEKMLATIKYMIPFDHNAMFVKEGY